MASPVLLSTYENTRGRPQRIIEHLVQLSRGPQRVIVLQCIRHGESRLVVNGCVVDVHRKSHKKTLTLWRAPELPLTEGPARAT